MASHSNVLVPDDMLEQSRDIMSTTRKIEDLRVQISGMVSEVSMLQLTRSDNLNYDMLSSISIELFP
jgi:regulator of replication initiation timing